MAAYFIAQYVVNDAALYGEYAAAAGPTVAAHGGEVIVFDVAAETIEGNPPGPQTVIIKFETTEQAKGWYDSNEYQDIVSKRIAASNGFSVLSQSMNPGG